MSIILPYSVVFAGIGLVESLVTLIDEITESRGRGNRECFGQGLANLVTGRLSGIVAARCLLCIILLAAPLIETIPLAALIIAWRWMNWVKRAAAKPCPNMSKARLPVQEAGLVALQGGPARIRACAAGWRVR